MSVLQPEEFRLFAKHWQSDELRTLVLLGLATGLRRGELLAVRWEDCLLDDGWLKVRQSLTEARGRPVLDTPK